MRTDLRESRVGQSEVGAAGYCGDILFLVPEARSGRFSAPAGSVRLEAELPSRIGARAPACIGERRSPTVGQEVRHSVRAHCSRAPSLHILGWTAGMVWWCSRGNCARLCSADHAENARKMGAKTMNSTASEGLCEFEILERGFRTNGSANRTAANRVEVFDENLVAICSAHHAPPATPALGPGGPDRVPESARTNQLQAVSEHPIDQADEDSGELPTVARAWLQSQRYLTVLPTAGLVGMYGAAVAYAMSGASSMWIGFLAGSTPVWVVAIWAYRRPRRS
jgi:hypothetical protein